MSGFLIAIAVLTYLAVIIIIYIAIGLPEWKQITKIIKQDNRTLKRQF